MRPLVLWDVDHTLIDNAGTSKAAYAAAFRALVGTDPSVRPATDGRTDIEIMRNLFAANGVDGSFPELERSLITALRRSDLLSRGSALPGAAESIRAIDRDLPTAVQSVLTGNLAENAGLKLRLLGDAATHLDLDIGAYGSDDATRSNLVAIAQDRAATKHGTSFTRASTVLIGDTTRDVAAALTGGARCLAVATGPTPAEDLAAAGHTAYCPISPTPPLCWQPYASC